MTANELAELHRLVFRVPRPFTETEFADFLADPNCFFCTVAPGFVLGRVIADEAEMLTLAVDPTARRQGLGTALVDSFQQEAQRRGATRLFLEVDASNHAAIALYRRAGFETMGTRRAYYRHPGGATSDALVMGLETSK